MKTQNRFFALLLLFISTANYCQDYIRENTYLDAVKLAELYEKSYFSEYRLLLKKYNIKNVIEFQSNPFFQNLKYNQSPQSPIDDKDILFYREVEAKYNTQKTIDLIKLNKLVPAISSPMNFQSDAINGIATFMAGRFKQEVLQVTINQFFKHIKEDSFTIVEGMFPKTFNYVKSMDSTNTYYSADLILLKETAQLDLNEVPKNIAIRAEIIFPGQPDYYYDIFKSSYEAYDYSKSGKSINLLFNTLAKKEGYKNVQFKNLLITADIISKAMENEEDEEQVWIPLSKILPQNIDENIGDETLFFYGLLFEQLKERIPALNNQDIGKTSKNLYSLFDFIVKLNAVNIYAKEQNYHIKTPEQAIIYIKDINEVYTIFLKGVKENQLFSDFNLEKLDLEIPVKYINIIETFINKKYDKLIPLALTEFREEIGKNNYSRTLIALSQIAVIENPSDMEAVLQYYALPIGSSSIKRHSTFNVSLNGYVGFTGGFEKAFGSNTQQTKGNIGLAAPIGLSFTTLKGRWTAFVSIIDLGTIVNQRLGNDTTNYGGLKFESFLAPGLGMYYNIRNLPISFGMHYNRISNLRNIDFKDGIATTTETNVSVNRLNLSILVDIPFFNIYNGSSTILAKKK